MNINQVTNGEHLRYIGMITLSSAQCYVTIGDIAIDL